MEGFTEICEKCKHWHHLYKGIYVCCKDENSVSFTPCGDKNDYAEFEPHIETEESK